jgi:formylglycine-generating enzyme required for sulfatase activity
MRLVALLSLALVAACTPGMVRIAPGVFVAGSPAAETVAAGVPPDQAAREQPPRTVTFARGFAIQRTEVTRGAFARFVSATGWIPGGSCSFLADGPTNRWDSDATHDWRNPGFAQSDAHPVVCVSHAEAQAYAKWLSAKTGRRFRLPSGDEWEYAARAGTTGQRWWGEAPPCAFANVADRARAAAHNRGIVDPQRFFDCDDGHVHTAPVASFLPNRWGLHDMLGNVWEWTSDCAPTGCAAYIDRGASWTNSPRYLRAAARHPDAADARTTVLGFRLVEDLP